MRVLRFRTRFSAGSGRENARIERTCASAQRDAQRRIRAAESRARRVRRRARGGAPDARRCRRQSPRRRAAARCSSSSSPCRRRRPRRSASRSPGASASSRSCARKSPLSQTGPTISQCCCAARARPHRVDRMPRVVERGTQQIVHRGVDDREALRGARLQELDAREQHAGVADQPPARLEQQPLAAPAEELAHHRARSRRSGTGVLVAVANAEAAAQVDVRQRDAVGAQPVDELQDLDRRLADRASSSVICEPMWMSSPCTAMFGRRAARR